MILSRSKWFRLPFILSVSCVSVLCALLINIFELECITQESKLKGNFSAETVASNGPTYTVYGSSTSSTGHLKHVFQAFELFGYVRESYEETIDWDVMWAHEYPFNKLSDKMRNLKPHQRVNHFPGCGYITNKVDLALSGLPYIPKAFKMPQQRKELLKYKSEHPHKALVQKSNDHRGIEIKNVEDLNFEQIGTFIQEYIDNPLLVDGYKFDIGIYTIITSIDPLRVYAYGGDVLLRFCPEEYYPFDPRNLNKYVVGDDYLPTWKVPSLKHFMESGYSMKDAFDAHMRLEGRDPSVIWEQIDDSIRLICLNKEPEMLKLMMKYKSKRNFFEMMRFDFIVDDNLNVFAMEVNMSPNLSSAHFVQNSVLYIQVLYSLFHLVGLATYRNDKHHRAEVSKKNLMVTPEKCTKCETCTAPECYLCHSCLTSDMRRTLEDAYLEHMNRHDCRRVFPAVQVNFTEVYSDDFLSPENKLMTRWFQEKCKNDATWC